MTTKKEGGVLKPVLISVACIVLFSAAFVGINNLAFAEATNRAEGMPLATMTAEVPTEVSPVAISRTATVAPTRVGNSSEYAPTENFPPAFNENATSGVFRPPAHMTIYENPNQPYVTMPHIRISHEEATLLGAHYIWDMFGESIDGLYVSLLYATWPSHTRSFVMGEVTNTKVDRFEMDWHTEVLFSFTLDAVTGERISVFRFRGTDMSDEVFEFLLNNQDNRDLRLAMRTVDTLPFEQLEDFTALVTALAGKHFTESEIVDVEFQQRFGAGFAIENGELVVTDHNISFTVTDSLGVVADVIVNESTRQLVTLCTSNSFIVPGFSFGYYYGGLG